MLALPSQTREPASFARISMRSREGLPGVPVRPANDLRKRLDGSGQSSVAAVLSFRKILFWIHLAIGCSAGAVVFESIRTAIETAQRSDTIIYSILFKDDEDRSFGGGFGGICQ